MCIVADKVEDVSNTRIVSFQCQYVIKDGDIKSDPVSVQLVVYETNMKNNAESNALILPVYNVGNNPDNILPLDFSSLPEFINDINKVYENNILRYKTINNSSGRFLGGGSLLAVNTVGDYKFSIVPSKYDFDKIDKSELNIDPAAKVSVDVHSDDYSFIVYQFSAKGKLQITPFGYLCQNYQADSMIVPTIHGHPEEGPTGLLQNNLASFERMAYFDHAIYTLIDAYDDDFVVDNGILYSCGHKQLQHVLNKIEKDYLGRNISITIPNQFKAGKIKINGHQLNKNLIVNAKGHGFMNDLINKIN